MSESAPPVSGKIRLAAAMLTLAAIGLLFVGAEVYLRVAKGENFTRPTQIPGLRHELIPNYKGIYKGVEYRTNQYGFRGGDFPVAKPPGEYRILILGDSIAQGGHVKEDEAMGAQLQHLLAARAGFEHTRVINGGVSGYDINDYLATYRYKGIKFDPDYIVVGLTLNDHFPFIGKEHLPATNEQPSVWEHSLVLRSIVSAIAAQWPQKSRSQQIAELAAAIPDPVSVAALVGFLDKRHYTVGMLERESLLLMYDLDAWQHIRAPLRELAELARNHGAGLLVVVLPVEFQLQEGFDYPQPQKLIGEICASLGIQVLDVKQVLKTVQEQKGHSLYARHGDMGHFNAEAHAAVARAISDYMQHSGALVAPTSPP